MTSARAGDTRKWPSVTLIMAKTGIPTLDLTIERRSAEGVSPPVSSSRHSSSLPAPAPSASMASASVVTQASTITRWFTLASFP